MGVMDKTEMREWRVFENKGKKIFGVIHLPFVQNPPLVITMHGFASHKIGTGRSYVTLAEALCRSGIACFRFDFRGSGDSEGLISEMTLEDFISDALQMINEMQKEGFSKVGLFGSSLGGTLSILTAARKSAVRALVAWAPVASGELWFKDYLEKHPEAVPKDPSQTLSNYRGVALHPLFKQQFGSMVAYKTLEEIGDIPFLHFQGEQDEVLSQIHQRMFQKHRERASTPSRFVSYPEVGHWLGHSKVLAEVVEQTVQWFKKYL